MTAKTAAPRKTVRTTYRGVMLSLPSEGVVAGGTAVHLSPRLEEFLEYDWARRPIPSFTGEDKDNVKTTLIAELIADYGLDQKWAETFAESRVSWNRP